MGIARPGVAAFLVWRCGGVETPELFTGFRIPAIDKTTRAVFAASDAGDDNAVGN